jgi:arsenite methyltransferase
MTSSLHVRDQVRQAYSAAAEAPDSAHPFPVGRAFALSVGYPSELLDTFAPGCIEAFTGVSDVSVFSDIPTGAAVLDLGCGAGLDSLIAARRAGPGGRVIGIDFSDAMLVRARQGAAHGAIGNALFVKADAERLPVMDASIAVALVNGIFNLNPAREAIFRELARVMQAGGRVYAAELILTGPLPPDQQRTETHWFA